MSPSTKNPAAESSVNDWFQHTTNLQNIMYDKIMKKKRKINHMTTVELHAAILKLKIHGDKELLSKYGRELHETLECK